MRHYNRSVNSFSESVPHLQLSGGVYAYKGYNNENQADDQRIWVHGTGIDTDTGFYDHTDNRQSDIDVL